MKTFLAVLFLVACAAGQTSQQMKDQTMTLPYPLYQKRGFIAVTSDGVGHWCETNKPSVYTPAITLNKNGSVSCPAGAHVVSDKEKPMPKEFLEPEPMDVPAMKIPIGDGGYPVCIWYYNGQVKLESCWDSNGKPKPHATPTDKTLARWKWTCADQSRILLTSEDGSKHCVKFPKD